MQTVLLVTILLVAIALVAVILIQRSEGGAFGMGGGGGTMGGFMTARGASNFLTRTTAILAAVFMGLSLLLAVISQGPRERRVLIPDASAPATPGGAPALSIPGAPPAAPAADSPTPTPPAAAPAQPAATPAPPAAPIAR